MLNPRFLVLALVIFPAVHRCAAETSVTGNLD